jgi:hypothetical protein
MNARKFVVVAAALAVLALAGVLVGLLVWGGRSPDAPPLVALPHDAASPLAVAIPSQVPLTPISPATEASLPMPARPDSPFDPAGQLIVNQDLRLDLEQLLVEGTAEELHEVKQGLSVVWPERAAAQAARILEQIFEYRQELARLNPAKYSATAPDDELADPELLQALRIKHFGADGAQRLFGK